jgi:hypothetical protein
MTSPTIYWLVLLPALLCASPSLFGEETHDVVFSTPDVTGKPTTANFYYNGGAIGEGREGFAAIVERIGKLPRGTSIVWGPNYARCGSCSGIEPNCVPKFLYPDLWHELEKAIREHELFLSSDYPGPWLRPVGHNLGTNTFAASLVDVASEKERFDAVIDWKVGEGGFEEKGTDLGGRHWHRFSSEGRPLDAFHRDLLLSRLPERARLLVRISFNEKLDTSKPDDNPAALAHSISTSWREWIAPELKRGKLKAVVTTSPKLAEPFRAAVKQAAQSPFSIAWTNFRGPTTPHEEVLYQVNSDFVGRGNDGFSRTLARLEKLPPNTVVTLPCYQLSGRWVFGSFSPEELEARNAKLNDLTPFATRLKEFQAKVAERKLKIERDDVLLQTRDPRSVRDWDSGDRYGDAFVSFGRIVRYDEEPRPAAVRLAWSGYRSESEVFYTLNATDQGKGVTGFAAAMEKLAKLPKGSVVDVRVCLRTRPPFTCPITFEGRRHFERTGYEPYMGMFPWLIDVARKQGLEIQWMPDELKTSADCSLNK